MYLSWWRNRSSKSVSYASRTPPDSMPTDSYKKLLMESISHREYVIKDIDWMVVTFWAVSLFRMSATDHLSIEAENLGSTEADPSQVIEISLVFMVLQHGLYNLCSGYVL